MKLRLAKLGSPKYFRWRFVEAEGFDIFEYIRNEEYVCDADNCGVSRTYWVLMTEQGPQYYMCKHEWWIEWEPEWNLQNEFEIRIIEPKDIEDKYSTECLRFVI